MLIKLQVLYKSLLLILLVASGTLFGTGVIASILLAVTGNATVRGFSIAVFNLSHLVAAMFFSLTFIWLIWLRVDSVRAILSEGPLTVLTRRRILKLAEHTTAILILMLGLLIVINNGYEVAGSIVRYGLTAPGPGHRFVCELLYLCN